MKAILILLTFVVSAQGCAQQKITQIEYQAISRGFYYKASVNADHINLQPSRNAKEISVVCAKKDWKALQKECNNINLSTIENLKAPSDKFTYDGAASAHITVTVGKKQYISNNFDHGNPPKEIAPLVNLILSLAESVEKQ